MTYSRHFDKSRKMLQFCRSCHPLARIPGSAAAIAISWWGGKPCDHRKVSKNLACRRQAFRLVIRQLGTHLSRAFQSYVEHNVCFWWNCAVSKWRQYYICFVYIIILPTIYCKLLKSVINVLKVNMASSVILFLYGWTATDAVVITVHTKIYIVINVK